MLAKKFRLTHYEFLLAKKTGKSINSPDMNLVYCPNSLGFSRFAIVTSTKLSKSAVVRNHLRRQIYSLLQEAPTKGVDIVFYPKISMLNLSYAEIGSKVDSLLSKLPQFS